MSSWSAARLALSQRCSYIRHSYILVSAGARRGCGCRGGGSSINRHAVVGTGRSCCYSASPNADCSTLLTPPSPPLYRPDPTTDEYTVILAWSPHAAAAAVSVTASVNSARPHEANVKFLGLHSCVGVSMRPSSVGGGRILRRTLSVCLSVCLSVRPVRVFVNLADVRYLLFCLHVRAAYSTAISAAQACI